MSSAFTQMDDSKKLDLYIKKDRLRTAFHEAGMRLTRQRLAIYRELRSRFDHPDVDHIFQAVKPKIPQISLFTVYRTMNVLEDAGMVQRVATWKGRARYDGVVDMHAHFLCEACGRLEDVELKTDCDEMMAHARACVQSGEVHRVDIMMSGVCKDCLALREAAAVNAPAET